jgi:steroid 5-alpha reductase family enzyme
MDNIIFSSFGQQLIQVMQQQKPFFEIIIIYLVIGLSGFLAYKLVPVENEMIRFFLADLVMTVVTFAFSLYKKNSSVYDPYWTVIPFYFILMWWMLYHDSWGAGHYLTAAVISFWSWRLTHNWYRGFPGWHHEDWRYVNFRKQFGPHFQWINFSGIHLFPTLIVFLGMIGLFWLYDGTELDLNLLIIAGCATSLLGTLLEFFADNVLHSERNNPARVKGACIRKGLWGYSRNPNYLGEMLFWIGLALVGLGAGAPLWTISGALAMMAMFIFASIPMKEKRLMESRTDFAQYKEDVSVLIPMKGRR